MEAIENRKFIYETTLTFFTAFGAKEQVGVLIEETTGAYWHLQLKESQVRVTQYNTIYYPETEVGDFGLQSLLFYGLFLFCAE